MLENIKNGTKSGTVDVNLRDLVWSRFTKLFQELEPDGSAATLRAKALATDRARRPLPASVTTDWNCLVHSPEHMFPCGHGVCDECVEKYNKPIQRPYAYSMEFCQVCGMKYSTVVVLKPPTVDPNILTFDGGGIRGIVELILLKRLQTALRSDVREYFEYIGGTSAGVKWVSLLGARH